ncbi:MAG: hypothetical protein H6825_16160 [Planctomycetes bacterium]|nr:hypothetical protein [Planctomycetota bacterium]
MRVATAGARRGVALARLLVVLSLVPACGESGSTSYVPTLRQRFARASTVVVIGRTFVDGEEAMQVSECLKGHVPVGAVLPWPDDDGDAHRAYCVGVRCVAFLGRAEREASGRWSVGAAGDWWLADDTDGEFASALRRLATCRTPADERAWLAWWTTQDPRDGAYDIALEQGFRPGPEYPHMGPGRRTPVIDFTRDELDLLWSAVCAEDAPPRTASARGQLAMELVLLDDRAVPPCLVDLLMRAGPDEMPDVMWALARDLERDDLAAIAERAWEASVEKPRKWKQIRREFLAAL